MDIEADLLGYAYAAFIIIGGVFGYFSTGSVPSLAAGLVFGAAATYGAWKVSNNPADFQIQLCTVLILALIMGFRFMNSGKMVPGVVCMISVSFLVWILRFRARVVFHNV